jgi:rhomboid protease GluP
MSTARTSTRWEPAFPKGVDAGFQAALLAQTPRAWVTPLVVALSVVVFVAMAITGVDPWTPSTVGIIKWGANHGPLTAGGQSWRLLTSAFVHIGAPHLVVNMIVLWHVGFFVERLVGSSGFLLAYLVAALCGSIASLAWNPYVASAGASGAVFGVYGVLVGYLARNRGCVPPAMLKRLGTSALLFVLLNLALGLAIRNVDLANHLGGLLAGLCAGLVLARPLGSTSLATASLRVLVLVAFGAVAVVGVFARQSRPVNLSVEMKKFYELQSETVNLYDAAVLKQRQGRLSDADFVKILDDQVRPPWQKYALFLRGLDRLRGAQRKWVTTTSSYIDLREHAWSLISEAVRSRDAAKMAEAMALDADARALAQSVRNEKQE